MRIRTKLITGIYVCSFLAVSFTANANAVIINDAYIGGMLYQGSTYDYTIDAIGGDARFGVSHMDVNNVGSKLVIDIYSRYYDNIGASNTRLGDLFLSTDGWNPNNPTSSDTSQNGESWELAFVLDDHMATSGSLSLFAVDPSNIGIADDQGSTEFRWGQEVVYDGAGQTALSTAGTWAIHNLGGLDTDDFLRFEFDYADLGTIADTLGIRWSMTCANDIIEGGYNPVPEPATALLFGTGLVAFMGMRRKGKKS